MQTQEAPPKDDRNCHRKRKDIHNTTEDDDPTPRLGHGFKKLDGTQDNDPTPKAGHGFRAVDSKQEEIAETVDPTTDSKQDSEKGRSEDRELITGANVKSTRPEGQLGEGKSEQTTRIGTDHDGYWRSGPSQRSSTEDIVATLEDSEIKK